MVDRDRRITAPKPARKRRDVAGFDRPAEQIEPAVVEVQIDQSEPVVDIEILYEPKRAAGSQ